ncbi:TetR/AcrR family transcriptional regulator [Henriciella litoralis]|uniref:TetR/AcrR family transcriptional regulator n=1 Tax=Henriciella litoralis TaxID=568102 RepID=UPI000A0798D9|nr:TetR/AcrR family transcriptional regulator [Henriciella litoralis]
MDELEITPAERRRIKVRGAILDAAERVFAQEGEAGLSIRRIADEIDYSPAAIYKYFNSKDDLVEELKETFFGRLLQRVHEIVDRNEPFLVRARKCVRGYIVLAIEKPHHYVAAFSSIVLNSDLPEHGYDDTNKRRAFEVLCGMMAEGIGEGHLREDLDPTDAAKSLWASMHGLSMMIAHLPEFPLLKGMPQKLSQADFISFHADLLIRSLERPNVDFIKAGEASNV